MKNRMSAIQKIKTDPELLERLKVSASKPLTREQRELQKISFIYGNLPVDSGISRESVVARVKKRAGL